MLDFAIPEDIRLRNREFTSTTCKVALTFQHYAALCVDTTDSVMIPTNLIDQRLGTCNLHMM